MNPEERYRRNAGWESDVHVFRDNGGLIAAARVGIELLFLINKISRNVRALRNPLDTTRRFLTPLSLLKYVVIGIDRLKRESSLTFCHIIKGYFRSAI